MNTALYNSKFDWLKRMLTFRNVHSLLKRKNTTGLKRHFPSKKISKLEEVQDQFVTTFLSFCTIQRKFWFPVGTRGSLVTGVSVSGGMKEDWEKDSVLCVFRALKVRYVCVYRVLFEFVFRNVTVHVCVCVFVRVCTCVFVRVCTPQQLRMDRFLSGL